jgi:hypothetical protein
MRIFSSDAFQKSHQNEDGGQRTTDQGAERAEQREVVEQGRSSGPALGYKREGGRGHCASAIVV